jgi:hypothetical protein
MSPEEYEQAYYSQPDQAGPATIQPELADHR